MTDGDRCIDGRQFYLRLAQRVMHLFSTRTSSGILYEVDARLRPSGAAGTGQHRRSVRRLPAKRSLDLGSIRPWCARIVHGDPALHQQFDAIRREILCKTRDAQTLKREVREMRERCATISASKRDLFDIKTDEGGITDIEFIAQYLVLRYAPGEPRLTRWSDNVRIFELMATTTSCRKRKRAR